MHLALLERAHLAALDQLGDARTVCAAAARELIAAIADRDRSAAAVVASEIALRAARDNVWNAPSTQLTAAGLETSVRFGRDLDALLLSSLATFRL